MGYRNPICYAQALDDCSPEESREHWMPRSMLRVVNQNGPAVLTQNHTFQRQEGLKPIGLPSLSSWILCKSHNNRLNDFDTAGRDTLGALDQMNAAAGDRLAVSHTHTVKGDDLERCMLKILLGSLYSGAYPIRGVSLKASPPPEHLLRILYCNAPFPNGHGLWVSSGPPGEVFATSPDMLKPLVTQTDAGSVIGLRIWMLSIQFDLVLADVPTPCPALEHSVYRPSGVAIDGVGKQLQFDWADQEQHQEIRLRWVGPG